MNFAFMMHDDDDPSDWDARKYPKSRPFRGTKGTAFENFVRDFGAAMSSEMDDDNDLEETMLGTDTGGDVYLTNGGTPATNAQQRRRRTRIKLLYGHLYRHVIDLRLREMMHHQARNDGRAAFQLLVLHCRQEITDLEMFTLDSRWDAVTFDNSVGVSIDTITNVARYLNGLNARRPENKRKNSDQLTLKLLSLITPDVSPTLNLEAQKEI